MSEHQKTCAPLKWDEFKFLLTQLFNDSRLDENTTLAKYHTVIALGGYTGLRPKALLSLSWMDVLDKQSDFFRESKVGKKRKITLHEDLQKILNKQFQWLDPKDPSLPILHNREGKAITTASFNQQFRKLLSKYDIETENPSAVTLRKTYAYRIYEVGEKTDEAVLYVQTALGHKSPAYTKDYLGITRQKLEDLMSKM